MYIVPEKEIADLMTRAEAYKAVEAVFAAMSRGDAYNFPVIREAIGHADALYGFKSGFDKAGLTLGLKSGGYWPGNAANGIPNHQSTVFLFNPDTGQLRATVGGNLLTALRTAGAAAVSVDYLARKDAKVLGMIGAGHQAKFQLRAVAETRKFEKVIAWNRQEDIQMLDGLKEVADEIGLPFESVSLDELGAKADVIVSVTSSFDPILMDAQVTPGTHLSCMGTDTVGKQEVEAALVARATCFTDEVAQSITLGECQHAVKDGSKAEGDIAEIGAVINGDNKGRTSDDEITLFDGTGVGLQDLAVASAVVDRAIEKGVAIEVDF
jgi:ornithine cyclodeaminase